jgi:predicted nucleotidyltransferase
LVGGLAIHAWGYSRITSDIDLLTLLTHADRMDQIMKGLGYETLQRTEDFGNYLSPTWEMGRVDVLFAHRKYSTAMLQRAQTMEVLGLQVKVLRPEDLIGLKIQSSANNPERANHDWADIAEILQRRPADFAWDLVQEYFQLFGREDQLQELRKLYP